MQNALHNQLVAHFGTETWWDAARLSEFDARTVHTARRHLQRARVGGFTPGHVVAELGFGFWIGLLANRYHARLWETAGLNRAFPHDDGRRRDLHTALERLRKLRNRIAHHEPIFDRDLAYDQRTLLAVLAYLSDDAHDWCRTHSRFESVIRRKADVVAGIAASTF